MKKLLLSFFLACISTFAQAAYDFSVVNSDGVTIYYKYVSKDDKTVAVAGTGDSSTLRAGSYSGKIVVPCSVIYKDVEYTVTAISQDGMAVCRKLEEVVLPETIISIGNYAFEHCESLTSINIPKSVTSIGSMTFYDCKSLQNIELPKNLTVIESRSFEGCESLTEITIPAKVYNIGEKAFYTCNSLKKITMLPQRPPICGNNVFTYNNNGTTYSRYSTFELYVPASAYNAYVSAPTWIQFRNIITYDDSSIGPNKCSTPEITFSDNTLSFSCATPQSQIHYSYYLGNMGSTESGGELVTLTNKSNSIIVMAYATAEGYEQSAAVIKSFPFDATVNDINGDNKITIADVTTLIDVIVNK